MLLGKLLKSLVVVVMASSMVAAQESDKKETTDPSGTWKWEREFNQNKIDYTLRLTWKEKKLSGTYKTTFENGPAALSEPVKIDVGKVDGDNFSFSVTRSFNDNEFTVLYAGKFAKDTITGTATVDFGNGPQEFEWTAKRTLTLEDVVGKWQLKFETQNGVIESKFTMAKVDDKLKGTYHSNVFGDNPIKSIELKDNKLSFEVTFETDNGQFNVTYKAEPRGDKLTGVILSNFGGQEREIPFEGKRLEEKVAVEDDNDDGGEEDDGDA